MVEMGNHVTVHQQTARASVRTTGKPMINLTLFSYNSLGAQPRCNLILHIHVVIN